MKGRFAVLALMLILCVSLVPLAPDAEAAALDWTVEGQMPAERSGFVSAELSDGRMFLALGYNSSAATHIDDAWIFDPEAMTWTVVADSPVSTESSAGACINDVVYIFGGLLSNYTHMLTVLMYDVQADEWSVGPVAPFDGTFLRAAAIDEHRILIVGTDTDLRGCYVFDTDTLTFSAVGDLPQGRLAGTLVDLEGRLLYFGGWDQTNTVRAEVYAYDIEDDLWWVADLMPEARFGMAGVVGSDGLIYLLGGAEVTFWYSDSLADCLAYDIYQSEFIELPDLPEGVRYAAGTESSDGRIICYGGHEGDQGMLNVYSVQAWTAEAQLSSDTVEQGGSVFLSISVRTSFAPMEELYGYAFLTAMGVTYAQYLILSLGDMAYIEIPISENAMPMGYVLELSGLGYNYQQRFVFEPMSLTVTEAPSADDRLDDMQDQLDALQEDLDAANADLKEAVDAKLDAMIGYVILIVAIGALIVGVIILVRKK